MYESDVSRVSSIRSTKKRNSNFLRKLQWGMSTKYMYAWSSFYSSMESIRDGWIWGRCLMLLPIWYKNRKLLSRTVQSKSDNGPSLIFHYAGWGWPFAKSCPTLMKTNPPWFLCRNTFLGAKSRSPREGDDGAPHIKKVFAEYNISYPTLRLISYWPTLFITWSAVHGYSPIPFGRHYSSLGRP